MYVQKTPRGFDVVVGPEVLRLKPAQAEKLVASILSEMPNIPDRVKLAWDMRTVPRGKIIQRFKVRNGELHATYRLEVYVPNNRTHSTFVGPECDLPLDAVLTGYDHYGEDIEITEVVKDLVSEKIAKKQLERAAVARTVLRKYGMNMHEIVRYVKKHKALPPEKKE